MKKHDTKKIVSYHIHNLPVDKSDWKRVHAMSDKELQKNARSDKDSFIADEDFWRSAKLVMPSTTGKERVTLRLDKDILDSLKEEGPGYQSRINAVLRSFVNAKKTYTPSHKVFSTVAAKKSQLRKTEHSKHRKVI